MADIRLISCIGVDFELPLVGHFVRHYRALGIVPERMHLILNAPTPDSPALAEAIAVLGREGVEPAKLWIAPYTSGSMWAERRALQEQVAAPGDWIVSADVDEFHEYPAPLEAVLGVCARRGVSSVQGVFVDRLAPDGALRPVDPETTLDAQFPLQADVICSLGGLGQHHDWFGTIKLMAFRAPLLPGRGGHGPLKGQAHRPLYGKSLGLYRRIAEPGFRFAVPTRVHHYKWTSTLGASLERRLATPGVSPAGAEYGAKLLAHLARDGRLDPARLPLRRPNALWEAVPWMARVLWLRKREGLERRLAGLRDGRAGRGARPA